jgi:hypothetical protein
MAMMSHPFKVDLILYLLAQFALHPRLKHVETALHAAYLARYY